eukprot:GFYU01002228.1.p1 GENE.GFYU01002228.1~~GFYU01002228.1.p1  ORF type:complete len:543 (-),score=145.90 GFYU01002228.1:137-1765(-)
MDHAWNSRRTPVYGLNGMAATSQPLASRTAIKILDAGGNAADAAVAAAAVLNVTEPCSTGIGGDAFMLFYDAKTKKVHGLNGSGRSPKALTLEKVIESGVPVGGEIPFDNAHAITVPGTTAAWIDTTEKFGKIKDIKTLLQPAIEYAEKGFPVSDITAEDWDEGIYKLVTGPHSAEMLLEGGRAPKAGEIMKLPNLAKTFREVAEKGRDGFYKGRIAEKIVEIIQQRGGVMSLEDLSQHESSLVEPICVNYHGVDVYEIPPNGQGIAALIALNILEGLDMHKKEHNSTEYLHAIIEALRMGFADARHYVADMEKENVPVQDLLSKDYAATRRALMKTDKAVEIQHGDPIKSSDTVYFTVVDGEGNACSFINSNYDGFGSGLIPEGCGFTLQNRGSNFNIEKGHSNSVAGNKRPFHTIIPGMAVQDGELYCSFGVMGGFNQPQGHVQVMLNMIDHGMNSQRALDMPRLSIRKTDDFPHGEVGVEEGVSEEVVKELRAMGHDVVIRKGGDRRKFGRGQIISRTPESGVLCGGCDPRCDGTVIGI